MCVCLTWLVDERHRNNASYNNNNLTVPRAYNVLVLSLFAGNSVAVKALLDKYFLYPAGDKFAAASGQRRPNFQVVVDVHEVCP